MNPRLFLVLFGILLDVIGFLLIFTSWFQVPVAQWEAGLVILGVGIAMDVVGLLV